MLSTVKRNAFRGLRISPIISRNTGACSKKEDRSCSIPSANLNKEDRPTVSLEPFPIADAICRSIAS